nr:Unknown Function [uncultured bacterium]
MLKTFIKSQLKKFGAKYDYDTSYIAEMLDVSLGLFMNYNKFVKVAGYRKKSPKDIYYVARIAALKVADCGPCLQLTVNFAKEAGVQNSILEAAVRNPEQLNPEQLLSYDFGYAVASNADNHDVLSEEFEKKFGKEILMEVSFAVATAIVYPTLKRGLRHAKSCRLVKISV